MADDTIYRQDAIDALMAWEEDSFWDEECLKHRGEPYWVAPSDVIEKLPSAPQWVPCSERLPEDDTEVFVYLFDPQSPYIAWVCDGCWFTEEFQVEKENYPKAWMPLPEPYKENEG